MTLGKTDDIRKNKLVLQWEKDMGEEERWKCEMTLAKKARKLFKKTRKMAVYNRREQDHCWRQSRILV